MTATPTPLRELPAMTPKYMAEVVQAAIETLCANGFQSRTHRLCEVRDQLLSARDAAGAVGSAYDGLCPCCGEIECEEPATPPAASVDDAKQIEALRGLLRPIRLAGLVLGNMQQVSDVYRLSDAEGEAVEWAIRRLAAVAPAGMVLVPRKQLEELAEILGDGSTTTSSGLPVSVPELIDVQQGAAGELRRMLAPTPPATAGEE